MSKDFLQSPWHYTENENYITIVRAKEILTATEHNTGYHLLIYIR